MSAPSSETVGAGPVPPWFVRALLVIVALGGWFWTQSLIGQRAFGGAGIGDGLHILSAPIHRYLVENPGAANGLLIVSSGLIDLLGVFLLGRGIFGPSIRPFLGLLLVFGLRQVCQGLCALPPPPGMIWRDPGFPSLLVTYGVGNDLFFSGHTAIAVLGAMELARMGRRWLAYTGTAIALFEGAAVIFLRAHYTMDVFAGAVTAMLVSRMALRLAPSVDRVLCNWGSLKFKV